MLPASPDTPLRILLIEDSEHDAIAFSRALEKSELQTEITHFLRAGDALETLDETPLPFDLIVADYKLPGMTGLELCKDIIARKLPVPCIVITGAGTEHIAVEAFKAGVNDYLVKDMGQHYLEILPFFLPEVVKRYRLQEESLIFTRERKTVASVSEMFLAPEDIDTLYNKLSQALAEGFGFPMSAIMLVDENRQGMFVKGAYGVPATEIVNSHLPLDTTHCGIAIAQGVPSVIEDFSTPGENHCFFEEYGVATCLAVPIKSKNSKAIGAISLGDTKKHPDARIHLSALQVIANHLGQEIERKEAEKKLSFEWQRCWSLLEELPALVCLQSTSLDIQYSNRHFKEKFGELGGKCYTVLMGRDEQCSCCPSHKVLLTRTPEECDCCRPRNGQTYHMYHYHRVTRGGHPPPVPTERSVRISRTTLFKH